MSTAVSPPAYRLPWVYIVSALIAMVALHLTGRSTVLFLLVPAMIAVRFTDARFDDRTWQVWLTRFVAIGLILMTGNDAGFRGADTFVSGRTMDWFGQYCAVELTLQCWIRKPVPPAGWLTVLSGTVFLAASNTLETGNMESAYIRYLSPLYIVLAAFAMRAMTERDRPPSLTPTPQVMAFGVTATLLVVTVGWSGFYGLWIWRGEITRWSNDLLFRDHSSEVGLSTSPRLGATRDLQGPLTRVLRVRRSGPANPAVDDTHLRALAFYSYKGGEWGPSLESRQFTDAAYLKQDRPSPESSRLNITRFTSNRGLILAPLGTQNLSVEVGAALELDSQFGQTLRSIPEAPFEYDLVAGSPDQPASIHTPPNDVERARCLEVPTELDSRVLAVAAKIGNDAGIWDGDSSRKSRADRDIALAQAVEQYLTSNHEYSLSTEPGVGDPISNFILQKKSAHCEYFASAAVVLLRCLGVPSRYVSGYYAHEVTGFGSTIVRQRDAHAWAEALVDGVGWVTVEATPSNGRPDATDGNLPPWTRLSEWFQDLLDTVRSWIVRSVGIVGSVVIGISVIGFLVWRDIRRSKRLVQSPAYAYSAPADLIAVADRFEALLAKKGWQCPAERTWKEHLAPILDVGRNGPGSGEPLPPAVPDQLRERLALFVANYNHVRFGEPANTASLGQLADLLQDLEKQTWPNPETLAFLSERP